MKHCQVFFYCFALFGIITVSSAYGIDVGITLDSTSGVEFRTQSEQPAAAVVAEKLSLWLHGSPVTNLRYALAGSYTFQLDRPVFLTLDLAEIEWDVRFNALPKTVWRLTAGRSDFSEFSGYVFFHPGDGLTIQYEIPVLTASFTTVYLGLLQVPESSIIVSASDEENHALAEEGEFNFGPPVNPHLLEIAEIEFPELFLRQTLHASVIFHQDFTPAEALKEYTGRVQTQYFGIGMGGPTLPDLYWNGAAYLNTGQSLSGNILAVLGALRISYYRADLLALKLGLGGIYASGDHDHFRFYEGNNEGRSNNFVPLSETPLGVIFSPRLSNLAVVDASVSLKPLQFISNPWAEGLQTELRANIFFRPAAAPISVPVLDPGAEEKYLGTEIDLAVTARPYSDLGLTLSTGFFFPGSAFYQEDAIGFTALFVSLTL